MRIFPEICVTSEPCHDQYDIALADFDRHRAACRNRLAGGLWQLRQGDENHHDRSVVLHDGAPGRLIDDHDDPANPIILDDRR